MNLEEVKKLTIETCRLNVFGFIELKDFEYPPGDYVGFYAGRAVGSKFCYISGIWSYEAIKDVLPSLLEQLKREFDEAEKLEKEGK